MATVKAEINSWPEVGFWEIEYSRDRIWKHCPRRVHSGARETLEVVLAPGSKLTAFVILPFVERDAKHPKGFFLEVLRSFITPAAASKECGFTVKTANRQGSEMIQ